MPRLPGRRRRGQLGAEIEQLALDAAQDLVEAVARGGTVDLRGVERPRDADRRVELVHRPVRLDPWRGLARALRADQVGLAVVATAGVDARDPDRHGPFPTVAPARCPPECGGRAGSGEDAVGSPRVPLDERAELLRVDRFLVDDVVETGELAALDDVILVEVERRHQHDR